MTEREARDAEERLRAIGYDVSAQVCPIGTVGWELECRAADGDKPLHAFTVLDARVLILGGAVARIGS